MDTIAYYHNSPPSFESKLVKKIICLFSMKARMEKKIKGDSYRKKAAEIPKLLMKRYTVMEDELNGNKVWIIVPKDRRPGVNILYLHGGAYYAGIMKQHWDLVLQLLKNSNARMIVPDYPLSPLYSGKEVYQFTDSLYKKLIGEYPDKEIIFMGDSAGGGLSLGFAMKIKNENIKQPKEIILLSPWLDASLSNPDVLKYEKEDCILSVNGLKMAGSKYAGNWDIKDYRVSPIFGNFSGLGRISIFIGTGEIFIADANLLKQLLDEHRIPFNYFQYPDMFHDWAIITGLKESKDVINKLSLLISDYDQDKISR